ncbi:MULTISPECIES: hypothetical protein [Bacillus cereus group]|uniref:DUF1878 domain-containing protein n=1 Tax=Bacillus thuringiensis TaxID=1428 RepID=A0A9W3V9K4_BACTU|nr:MULTISPECIES: hypothetical protein [Bacillus]MCU0094341.1 DUF1878 domain-containing protein [Bacillus sp. OR9]AMR06545.1 hypothetical protein AXW78_29970 [Bacillus thuringiensis]AYF81294.1 DUF1878 domain-containing protein [Bacillus thuringiensis]MBJ8059882.1 DUF1878 domain-containing protein [Bacillus cereus]MDA1997194.1 DUF1878 domain-containing protein [Bacillus cereus]
MIRYQINIIKELITNNEQPFYIVVVKYLFEEVQVMALLNILSIFKARLENKKIAEFNKNDVLFKKFNINMNSLYAAVEPSVIEFNYYVCKIFYQKIDIKILINSLKEQSIYYSVCSYLLNQIDQKELMSEYSV